MQWQQFTHQFVEGYFAAHPDFAVAQGRHDYDGLLPDWRRESLQAEVERLRQQRRLAEAFAGSELQPLERFERQHVLSVIDHDLFWLEEAAWPFKNPLWYADALDPSVYLSRPYAPPSQRLQAYIAFATLVPRAAAQIRANLSPRLPRTYIELGGSIFTGLASFMETHVPGLAACAAAPGLQDQLHRVHPPAVRALRQLGAWFQSRRPGAHEDFALGPELFTRMLRHTEGLDLSLDRLKVAGLEELRRNQAALHRACRRLSSGASPQSCVARVKADKPAHGPVSAARRQLGELKRFVQERDLVRVPDAPEPLVEEAPPHNRWNSACIDIPGPFDDELPSVYYIAPPDPVWTPEERQAYLPGHADLLFTSIHEVWPGHYLQYLHANRVPSSIGRTFVGYGFAEGWAHYAEELMVEAGLHDDDPSIQVGQILNALVRNVRYLVAIGLHTEGMSVEEAESMFRRLAYQDAAAARQQAARGSFDPAYLGYTLGKLILRKLRRDWATCNGTTDGWRQFHDRLLSYGGPPLPLLRQAMLSDSTGALL